jgi:hypothetical protein
MRLSVPVATMFLGLALAGCGGNAGPTPEAASGISSASSPPPTSLTPGPSGSGSSTAAAPAGAACTQQQTAPRPDLRRQLPAGFPTVTGWQPTRVADQGTTRAVSGVLRGDVGDLVTLRDTAADELVTEGYTQTGSDQEVGYEAEAEFDGPQEVSIKVTPLCRDYLLLTYTVRK